MELTIKLNLEPVQCTAFSWSKRKGKIHIAEVGIDHENALPLSPEEAQKVLSLIKKSKTDILTDGKKTYTILDNQKLVSVTHPLIDKAFQTWKANQYQFVITDDKEMINKFMEGVNRGFYGHPGHEIKS